MRIGEFCVVILTMIIFLEFIGISTGLTAITTNYGVEINDTTGELISADIENSTSYSYLFGLTGILVALGLSGAVVVGFFTKSFDTSLVILPLIVTTAGLFMKTSWTIISHVQELSQAWATNVITIIFVGIGVAFIWSCVDYFRGLA